jgi:hypothetical protein
MKPSVRKSETPRRRSAPRGNERRSVTQHPRRRILSFAAGAAALLAMSRVAWAQAYPTRPVRIVVGLPAGASHRPITVGAPRPPIRYREPPWRCGQHRDRGGRSGTLGRLYAPLGYVGECRQRKSL